MSRTTGDCTSSQDTKIKKLLPVLGGVTKPRERANVR